MAETTASGSGQQGRSDSVYIGSCNTCKKRKSKCDMKRPTCGSCDRRRWSCGYQPSRKKPGPRQGSRQATTVAVQRRLELLEGLLDSDLPRVTSRDLVLPTRPEISRQDELSEAHDELPADQNRSVRIDPETFSDDATLQLQLTAALGWHGYMKPPPPKSTGSEDPSLSPLTTLTEILISQDTERQLLRHFFADVKLPISVLCEEKFYRDYEAGIVPEFLLNAMFSLSARFSQAPEILGLIAMGPSAVGSYFSRKASLKMDIISGSNGVVSIAEITAAYLLAYHDFTYIPSRKAAEHCTKVVRMAYMADLHQIDNKSLMPQAADSTSELELEEKRCLWWGIFMLDTFSSLTSFVPSNIEDVSIASCLPTTVVSQITSQHVFCHRRACLDDDLDTFWSIVQHQEPTNARTQAVLIYVTAMAKDVTLARRLCLQSPRCSLAVRLNTLRQKWEMLLSTLPAWFFIPSRHALEHTGDDHHKRLETLTMIHTVGTLSSYPPLDLRLNWSNEIHRTPSTLEERWSDCVFHAQKIAGVYRAWTPKNCEKVDSLMLPMTWNADGTSTWDSVDYVMDCLHRSSRYWNIANMLMLSLEDLRAKSWRKIDTTTIFRLLLPLSAPQMLSKAEPKVTSEVTHAAAASTPGEYSVEDLMAWPTPAFSMPTADPSMTFDWSSFVVGNQALNMADMNSH